MNCLIHSPARVPLIYFVFSSALMSYLFIFVLGPISIDNPVIFLKFLTLFNKFVFFYIYFLCRIGFDE